MWVNYSPGTGCHATIGGFHSPRDRWFAVKHFHRHVVARDWRFDFTCSWNLVSKSDFREGLVVNKCWLAHYLVETSYCSARPRNEVEHCSMNIAVLFNVETLPNSWMSSGNLKNATQMGKAFPKLPQNIPTNRIRSLLLSCFCLFLQIMLSQTAGKIVKRRSGRILKYSYRSEKRWGCGYGRSTVCHSTISG